MTLDRSRFHQQGVAFAMTSREWDNSPVEKRIEILCDDLETLSDVHNRLAHDLIATKERSDGAIKSIAGFWRD
jgi:hypothetical protein